MAGGPYNPMGGGPMGGAMGGGGMGGPPMGGPPPMGGTPNLGPPPMGGAPMGPGPQVGRRPQVMRRGTSRAVPVVVSAGLAIGVFCGLLFGVGTGQEVVASPATGNNSSKVEKVEDISTAQTVSAAKLAPTTPPVTGQATPPVVATGSAGSAAEPAKTMPAVNGAKLSIGLKPDKLAKTAFVTVDGKEMKDGVMEVAFDAGTMKKSVKVVVKAAGYTDVEKMIEVDADTRVEIELLKAGKSTPAVAATGTKTTGTTVKSTGTSGTKTKTTTPVKKKPPPTGLIDI